MLRNGYLIYLRFLIFTANLKITEVLNKDFIVVY